MQILISSIIVPDRVRKDMGDLTSLMDSLRRCGQLNPITVTRDMTLVAGHRRYLAASRLGWRMIGAIVVDGVDEVRRLEIELEENIHRKDFSPEELLEGVRRLDSLRHPRPLRRMLKAVKKFFAALAFWRYFGRKKKEAQLEDRDAYTIGDNGLPEIEDKSGKRTKKHDKAEHARREDVSLSDAPGGGRDDDFRFGV